MTELKDGVSKHSEARVVGRRYLAIDESKTKSELSTAAFSRNEAGAVLRGLMIYGFL